MKLPTALFGQQAAAPCPVTRHRHHLAPRLLGDVSSSPFNVPACGPNRGLRKPPALLETFRNWVFTAWVGRGGHEDTDEPTCLAQKHFGWETHPVGALRTTPQPASGAWVSPRTPKHQGPHGPRLLLPGTPGLGPCQQRPAGSLLPFVAPCHTPELYETSSGFVDFEFPRLRQAGSNLP